MFVKRGPNAVKTANRERKKKKETRGKDVREIQSIAPITTHGTHFF